MKRFKEKKKKGVANFGFNERTKTTWGRNIFPRPGAFLSW